MVLIASVSPEDGELLMGCFEKAGWASLQVADADMASRQLDGSGSGRAVLVIDSGLLVMPHDERWRRFREQHPELGIVVRRYHPRNGQARPPDGRSVEVHPDDVEGTCEAVRCLAPAAGPCPGAPPLPGAGPRGIGGPERVE